ncbi:2-pyrone-4,6-dicarboxylate hydrolase [Saccharopolyspora karakumensis]|uniref:2-pyrone-4,6-dicarboxylate hydrolase n=1 Tax=Saccharopolyspora karakumensis TaxID=2530386 RepID=A0A4R5BSB8_9PSEU|nr:amidohydrolase family protein [Saccharopolyspora karakumensis]TDD86944.1 2-pyrone-4,6-dicarboxylate hydrolase [Saccharopolyspora karakumensis]
MWTDVTPGWLPWHPNPSEPAFTAPEGAVDAHCHVFGPAAEFPFAPERKYTPVDAGKEQLFALRDHLGLSRNVIVQATCHGSDNSALVDALRASDGRARGVASVTSDVTRQELERLHAAGVRGVRFNFVKRLVDAAPTDALEIIAAKIAPLGWHVVLYFEAPDLRDLRDFFLSLPVTLVIDHMGRPDVSADPEGPEFSGFLDFVARSGAWVKVSCPERLTRTGPPALDGEQHAYTDVVPFARKVVETFPDRVLWGTDWPHPNLTDHMPDDGLLLDHVPQIAATPEQRRALLVDNPMRLYWPEE